MGSRGKRIWDHMGQKTKWWRNCKKNPEMHYDDLVLREEAIKQYRVKESRKLNLSVANYLAYLEYLREIKGFDLSNRSKPIQRPKHLKEFKKTKYYTKKRKKKKEKHKTSGRPPGAKNKPKVVKIKPKKPKKKVGRPAVILPIDKVENIIKPPPKKQRRTKKIKTIGDIVDELLLDDDTELKEFTKRHWKGEHWEKDKWVLKKGCWYDPETQQWIKLKKGEKRILTFFYWYVEFLFDPTKYKDPHPLGQCHKTWSEQVEFGGKYTIFLCSRDHLKTTILNEGYMTYIVVEFPMIAQGGLLNISLDKGLALETFNVVIDNLSENDKILDFYGYVVAETKKKSKRKAKRTQDYIRFTYQKPGLRFGLKCLSFGSKGITGTHPAMVWMDDILDKPMTETVLKTFKHIIEKALFPAVTGRIVITGTIKGFNTKDDIYIRLGKSPIWQTHKYPAANKMPPWKDVFHEVRYRPAIDIRTNLPALRRDGTIIMEPYNYIEVKNRDQYIMLYPERYTIEKLVEKRFQYREDGESDATFWSEFFLKAVDPRGKFFYKPNIRSIQKKPPTGYATAQSFFDDCLRNKNPNKEHLPCYLFIDPGGIKSSSHGITAAVMCKIDTSFVVLDIIVFRGSYTTIGKKIANEIFRKWNIMSWGVEGNYDQANTWGEMLEVECQRELKLHGLEDLYKGNVRPQNKEDKIRRIEKTLNAAIGDKDQPSFFYINDNCFNIDQFWDEIDKFGPDMTSVEMRGFDVLDAISSNIIHLIGKKLNYYFDSGGKDAAGYFDRPTSMVI